MKELSHDHSNELSKKEENQCSLVRRVLRGGQVSEQEEEREYKSYWSDKGKDWEEIEEEHYEDPWDASMALREKEREEEALRKLRDMKPTPIPKPDFTYGALKRKEETSPPQVEESVIDHPHTLSGKNIESTVCDFENKAESSTASKKLLENPLHRLLALEEREQELEKKKQEFGKKGFLLENKSSDEGGGNPHGEID